jgi:release factor glutamine methyltransferase
MPAAPENALTIRALLAQARSALADSPHPEKARLDAEALLLHIIRQHASATNLAWLVAHQGDTAPLDWANAMRALVERRAAGEPIQYITGEMEFYRLPILVNRDVLIPRPETELLVEQALQLAPLFRGPRILDVGTGSGAIALAIAQEWPEARMTATDISEPALTLARHNAERLGLENRIRFLNGDLLEPVDGEEFEIVVSNPPYVAERDRDSLSIEVRDFEPAQALFAGEDGLDTYRRLIPAAFGALACSGFAVLEIGYGQAEAVRVLLEAAGFKQVEFSADLNGILRVAAARRP